MATADSTSRDPAAQLPLTPATFQVLLALAEGERHGYAIMREAAQRGDGGVKLGPGTLYGSLKRLLDAGMVAEGGGTRRPGARRRAAPLLPAHRLRARRAPCRRPAARGDGA